jgi:DNA-binding transcriptional regulator YiaG
MPNFASALKGEISRLSTKVARNHVAPVQSTTSALRKQVSALKKQLQALEREVAALKRRTTRTQPNVESEDESKFRFTAKGLRSLRTRLGLSADEFGRLLDVGQQTIYNWESEKTQPRRAQVPSIAALRKIGKREARARLENEAAGG